jgi:signal transduction histidine kinase
VALSDFIEENIETLVTEWEAFAKTRLPAAEMMDSGALRNNAEAILRAVAADMTSPQSGEQQKQKSEGGRPQPHSDLCMTARQHAAERLAAGFTLDQLVSEYRALRATVVRRWTSDMAHANRATLNELVRFDEAMDESLTEAIRWFHNGLERARHVFVGILGHDLRDPLNAALAAAQVQLAVGDPEARRKSAEAIKKNLHRMARMIDDLLDFTRTRLGERLPMAPQPLDLSGLCKDIVETFALSHPEREIRLRRRGDVSGTYDPERIRQLLSNLIKNALQYGAPATPVTLEARGEADEVILAVHNDGPRISQEKLHVIFDPLIRGDGENSGAGQPRNLGLGLYIVRQIVEAHGGSVEVESTAEHGTTFVARLPREPAGFGSAVL